MTIDGVAAGVPYTALPPEHGGPAPLVLTWHMLDAPRTNAAFAAALPMNGVAAWRVHLGLPMCGDRMVDGSMDAVMALARRDPLREFADGFSRQAAEEFPAALTALRAELPIGDGPLGIVGGSLGGLVALRVLTSGVPVTAAALVNACIRPRSLVDMVTGGTYPWDADTNALADELDFVKRAGELRVPLLVVSGEQDDPPFRVDAAALADAAPHAELLTVPGLAHPLADEPGLAPAPQLPLAKQVDDALTGWFTRHLR
ncbi:alpha/beta hydrolase family protein [Actinophytocola sp.]|uniref:alpha/beta hydrolase family protein n=1 Tax=Actinophytocola sp. TaxID=1872138 RepID=UPI00389AF31E